MKTSKQPHSTEQQQTPNRLTKAVVYTVIAAMLNTLTLQGQAAMAAEHHKQAVQDQANNANEDAASQMVELAAKHQLNTDFIHNVESQKRAGRSIFKRMIDSVIELFTDNSEEIAQKQAQDTLTTQLLALEKQLHEEHSQLIQQLQTQLSNYQANNMPQSLLTDQQQLINQLNQRYQQLTGLLNHLKQADDENSQQQALTALTKQLTDWQPKTAHTDMENLPWGMPKNEVRKPIVKENADITQASSTDYKKYHQSAIGQWRDAEYKIANYLLNQNPIKPIATLSGQTPTGNWAVLKALPAEVQPADLAENEDIQINQDIKTLAKQLEHNPAKIYKWVHDNIEFIPTYGSIQGSAFTLETKRGNATDTASLLIALLRASNIPARYVYGTVDIPAEFAKDWVGGVNNLDAAQNLLGQGGVPNTVLMSGSVAKYLRLEHVWVEAYIPALPSRGGLSHDVTTTNPKAWLPLDASYKSHTRTQGIDLAKAIPFNAEKLIADAKQGATIDEATGSVQNLNQNAINTAITDYQNQVKTYLEQNHPKATVGDVLGTDKINPYNSQMLSPVLPYQVNTVIADYQALPDNMKHYFLLKTFTTTGGGLYGGSYTNYNSPIMDVKIPTTQLQGKPFALSFKPTDQANENKLTALLPKDENGTLPSSLPTNITMTPELTLDGEIIASKGTYQLGSDVKIRYGIQSPNSNLPSIVNKDIVAGEYHAIGYNLQGMSQKQLERTKAKLEQTKAKLEQYQTNKDQTTLTGLTKHGLTGAIMQAGVQSYFAVNQAQDLIDQKQANIIANPYMSFGTFSTSLTTQHRYGIPFSTSSKGVVMDIDRILKQTVDKDNQYNNVTTFNLSTGPRESLNENLIPEQLFDNPNTPEKEANGISATKALQQAAQQGQTIYTITQANYNQILPKLNHDSIVMTDIRNAINAGKQVTVHANKLNYSGWSGTGYIILDTKTGAGAYMIGGGADGGFVNTTINIILSIYHGVATVAENMAAIYDAVATAIAIVINFYLTIRAIAQLFIKCNWEKILAAIVVAFALALLTGVEVGSGGLATPAVGALLLMLSVNANAAGGANVWNQCNCPSGIYGNDPTPNSQCWICHPNLYPISSAKVNQAKSRTEALGKCKLIQGVTTVEYLNKRISAWSNLVDVRKEHNACYSPSGPRHQQAKAQALTVINHCLSLFSRIQ